MYNFINLSVGFFICCCKTTDGMPFESLIDWRSLIVGGSDLTYCGTDIQSCISSPGKVNFLTQASLKWIRLRWMFLCYRVFYIFLHRLSHSWLFHLVESSGDVDELQRLANIFLVGDFFSTRFTWWVCLALWFFRHFFLHFLFCFQLRTVFIEMASCFTV